MSFSNLAEGLKILEMTSPGILTAIVRKKQWEEEREANEKHSKAKWGKEKEKKRKCRLNKREGKKQMK